MTRPRITHIALNVLSAIMAALLLVSAYGGLCDPRSWGAMPAVLVLAFPIVAIVALVWTLIVAAMRRWRALAALALAWLIVMPAVLRTCPVAGSKPVAHPDSCFTVMTLNAAAFPRLYPGDTSTVMRDILDVNADVVLIQEAMLAPHPFHYDEVPAIRCYKDELNRKYPYRSYPYNDDVAILSRYPFSINAIVPPIKGYDVFSQFSDVVHYATLSFDVTLKGRNLRFISTHLHSYGLTNAEKQLAGASVQGEMDVERGSRVYGLSLSQKLKRAFSLRASEAQQLRSAIDNCPHDVIVCGDFNDVAGSFAHRTIAGDDLRDAWSECGWGYQPTYAKYRFFFHIDHILYRGAMRAVDAQVYHPPVTTHTSSDHYPLVVKFEFIE